MAIRSREMQSCAPTLPVGVITVDFRADKYVEYGGAASVGRRRLVGEAPHCNACNVRNVGRAVGGEGWVAKRWAKRLGGQPQLTRSPTTQLPN